MLDEDLRFLEREAGLGGPAARIQYARALERAGRSEDAFEALVPSREDADVRRELARFPGWSEPDADGGGTRRMRVPLLRELPAVSWSTEIAPPRLPGFEAGNFYAERSLARLRTVGLAAACPLGILVNADGNTRLLDPFTGFERLAFPFVGRDRFLIQTSGTASVVAGDAVLALNEGREIVARDLGSGEDLARTSVEASALVAAAGLVLALGRSEVVAFDASAPRQPLRVVWRFAFRSTAGLVGQISAVASANRVLLWGRTSSLVGLDPADGRRVFRIEPPGEVRPRPRIDSSGFVLSVADKLVAFDLEGQSLWEAPGDFVPVALSDEVVVARSQSGRGATVFQRASGRVGARLELAVCVAVTGGLYGLAPDGSLVAASFSGERLWATEPLWQPPPSPTPELLRSLSSLACFGRWIFAAGGPGKVVALEGARSAS